MAARRRSPAPGLTSFALYEDAEAQELPAPPNMFDGDASFHSEEAIPSTELLDDDLDAPQPYKSSYTSRRSSMHPRRSSGVTHYSLVSALPSESSIASKPVAPASDAPERYTPRKERPRFRNPESVRALQMSSPPPLPTAETSRERLKGSYKLMTPSRSGRSETPVSKKSGSRRGSARDHQSPMPTPTPQQAPLVLLHVTILPPQVPYSHDLMERIMPEWLVENYKLLEEKLQDIILMRRGLLIPHPRDEYDLLEERILESLELKTPRLLKCGHFVPPDEDTDKEDSDDEASIAHDNTGRGSRMSGGTFTEELDNTHHADPSVCVDCHHELKRPGKGVGAGKRRWDIKIYAANGLMRANAWAACWGEMERCDVELHPWIPGDLRKTLERRVIEEQEAEKRKHMYAMELQRHIQESTAKQQIAQEEAAERKRLEETELQRSFDAAAAALQRSIQEKAAEKKKFEEAIELKIAEAKESMRLETEAQAQAEASLLAERLRVLESTLQERTKSAPSAQESTPARARAAQIPLGTLLKNYITVLLKDLRNLIIIVLGAMVVFLAMPTDTATNMQLASTSAQSSPLPVVEVLTVTTTATTTATSYSAFTITEIETATSVQEVVAPPTSHCLTTQAIQAIVEKPTSATKIQDNQPKQPLPENQASPPTAQQILKPSRPLSTSLTESSGQVQPAPHDTCVGEPAPMFQTTPLPRCAA
ncbi:hypothetical protein BDU57DRAFT_295972 [Ampelomyces quisqualis]|uniref:Pathway-specific nitrogen regulator n=1 Tax=Ampelomyces quisqualis TaxID=50730 RepID=A0A6A5QG21_AMPQU|nr:hypothetical protein BDU57DRAFT_295972 [Ampelomyces quisqualis]